MHNPLKVQNSKFPTTIEEAQKEINDAEKFSESAKLTNTFIDEQQFSEISKTEFIQVMEVLFSNLKFKPVWSDYANLWGSYENDYGERTEDMKDPQVLKKYLQDLAQEFIWDNS